MKFVVTSFVALLTVFGVACEVKNPAGPTPLPASNLVWIVWTSPQTAQTKGAPLSILVKYEATGEYDIVATPKVDANGTETSARSSLVARVRRGTGEVRLDGATVTLSSSAERTEYIEFAFTEPGTNVVRERILAPWAIRWYWPVRDF